eukprot:SM001957S05304  [mRNA]  locus=s1957:963:1736:- [translate_table: standard]
MPAGPQRLGGDSGLAKLLTPAQAAAMAAERRRDDDQWCAGASTASAAPGEEDTMRLQAAEREQQAAILRPSSAESNAGRERDEVGGTGRQLWDFEQPLERQEGDRSRKQPSAEAGAEDCEGMWACGACTLLNRPLALQCDACRAMRSAGGTECDLPLPQMVSALPPARAAATWACSQCTLRSPLLIDTCPACGQWRYSHGPPVSTRGPYVGT